MDFLRKKNPKVSLHQYRVFSTVKEKFEFTLAPTGAKSSAEGGIMDWIRAIQMSSP
jgi:hypothetical protein